MGKSNLTRVLACLIACLIMVSMVVLPAQAEPLDTSAVSAVLIDAASGTILFENVQ